MREAYSASSESPVAGSKACRPASEPLMMLSRSSTVSASSNVSVYVDWPLTMRRPLEASNGAPLPPVVVAVAFNEIGCVPAWELLVVSSVSSVAVNVP